MPLIRRATRATRAARSAALCAALAILAACDGAHQEPAPPGDAERGRLLLRQYGCGDCHRIPGVATADGTAGPPLAGMRRRVYLAGVLPNTPDNMARWIREPQKVKPQSLMPDLRVPPEHAVDMVAHLYRQR